MSTPTRRWRHRCAALIPGLFLAAGLALVPATPASAQLEGPQVTGDLSGNAIFGCNFAASSTVGEEVDQSQGGARLWSGAVSTDANGCFNQNLADVTTVVLAPGMFISVTDGTTTRAFTLASLSIDSIVPATGTVSGTAPDGAVNLWANTGDGGTTGSTTASGGHWTYSFGAGVITPLTEIGAAVTADVYGDSTGYSRRLFEGGLNVNLTSDVASLWHFSPNATATITLTSSTGAKLLSGRVTTDAEGNASYWLISKRVANTEAGMHVIAVDTVTSATLDLQIDSSVAWTSFDWATGNAAGTAPAGAWVDVNAYTSDGTEVSASTVTDGTGHWATSLGSNPGFNRLTRPTAWVSMGTAVGESVELKIPSLSGDLATNVVSGNDLAEVSAMTVSVYSAPLPGGQLLFSGSVTSSNNGSFSLTPGKVDLVPGMFIKLSGGASRELTLVGVTITGTPNLNPFSVAGTAPANADVLVGWGVSGGRKGGGYGDATWTTADSSGQWTASIPTENPTQATIVTAGVPDTNGNFSTTTWVPPKTTRH